MVNNELLEIIFLTLRVSGSALAIACVLGIPFGLILGSEEFRGKKIIQLLISTGMGLPPVVVGLVVYLLLSNQGPLGTINWLFSPSGMILSQSILAFPLAAGFTSSAIAAVSPKLIIQIRSMGTTSWQEKITIFSQARNGIIAAVLAAFGRIISEVGAVMLVGGNIEGHTRVLSTAIVLETRQGKFAFALSLGFVLLGIALLANSLTYYFGGQWEK
ncbi:MAG: ABC transporter permease [Chloroflexi bacterium]|nr:ABC transporter permease [Chloroflexota bacterium]MBT3669366.1 ABC transporter permease [Chloroflexota bacterium]MBT4001818.1 ABC transporter permease [Chloroflexota bacterium]MBT4534044.1 ABC transporter permease [Chloroflexota bacterium]MBT4683262.1 ABC transporter permease [Chloroflexota bacterium]